MTNPARRIPELTPTFFTLAGDIRPFGPSAVSAHSLRERAAAAARAGYRGFGFGFQDLEHCIDTHGIAGVNSILDDHGLVHREIEVLVDWFVEGPRRQASDGQRQRMLQAAEQLGARHIKVAGDVSGTTWPMDHMTGAFARLCDEARDAGTAVTIELFPTSNLSDLQTGRTLVEGAGRANGGLLLDIWHMVRGHITMDGIAALPEGIVNHVEIDDGTLLPGADYITDTIDNRLAPGEGEFPLADFICAVEATGYRGLYGVEILSDTFRRMPPEEAASRSFRAAAACFR
jgi:sugar phosphate isomerase/epimerase